MDATLSLLASSLLILAFICITHSSLMDKTSGEFYRGNLKKAA